MKRAILTAALALASLAAVAPMASASGSSCGYSLRGCVHVHGYTKSNGTYVQPYFRNYPSYGYSSPSYSYHSYSYPSYSYHSYSYPSYGYGY